MEKWQINSLIAMLGACLTTLFGGMDAMMQALIIICIVDYCTGILAAIYEGKLSSKIGFKGIIKKICMFAVVVVACVISEQIQNELLRTATIAFYISNESISILENVGRTGVKYPRKLRNILREFRDKSNKDRFSL